MAEQKFLGQEGTDVLVKKVKKNAEDILAKRGDLLVLTYDEWFTGTGIYDTVLVNKCDIMITGCCISDRSIVQATPDHFVFIEKNGYKGYGCTFEGGPSSGVIFYPIGGYTYKMNILNNPGIEVIKRGDKFTADANQPFDGAEIEFYPGNGQLIEWNDRKFIVFPDPEFSSLIGSYIELPQPANEITAAEIEERFNA